MSTHKDKHTLDLIIKGSDDQIAADVSVYYSVISNHFALHCNLCLAKPTIPKKKITAYKKLRSVNAEDFRSDVTNSSLCLSPHPSLPDLCHQYDTVLSTILDWSSCSSTVQLNYAATSHRKPEKPYPRWSSTTEFANHVANAFANKTTTITKQLVIDESACSDVAVLVTP